MVQSDAGAQVFYGAPRLSAHIVARDDLLERLDSDAPLTVLRAPLGWGKTTLLAQWAARADRTGVWVSIGEATSTRRAFWEHVFTLMADAGIRSHGRTLRQAAHAVTVTRDLDTLLVRVAASIVEPLTLVFDEYGSISDRHVHGDLVALLTHARRLRVLVATRALSELEAEAVELRLDTAVLRAEDLRFTQELTGRVLRIDELGARDALAELHAILGGVPLAVRAAGIALRDDTDKVLRELGNGRLVKGVAEYFTETLSTVYRGTPYFVFLVRISVAASVTRELAAELADVEVAVAARLLDRAEGDGLGMWRTEGHDGISRVRFTLTPMISAALQSHLQSEGPGVVARHRTVYAHWCLRDGDPFTAILEAVRADDLELASKALRSCVLTVGYLHGDALMSLLREIPSRKLKRYPALAVFVAANLNAREETRQRGQEWFRIARASARLRRRETGDPVNAFALAVAETVSARMIGEGASARTVSEDALVLYRSLPPASRRDIGPGRPQLLSLVGTTFLLNGQSDRALEVFQEAYVVGQGNPLDDCLTVPLLAGTYAHQGDMPNALRQLERAQLLDWPIEQRHDYFGAPYQLAKAYESLERFELLDVQRHIDAVAHTFISYEYWALFTPLQAFIDAARGSALAGLARLRDARRPGARPATSPHLTVVHEAWRILLHVSAGQLSTARQLVRDLPTGHPVAALARAVMELVSGNPAVAIAQTYAVQAPGAVAHPPDHRTEAALLLVRSAAAERADHRGLARDSLDAALALMSRYGFSSPIAFLPLGDRSALHALASASGMTLGAQVLSSQRDDGPRIPSFFPDRVEVIALTPREQRLLHHLSNSREPLAKIAEALNVAPKTLRNQRTSLYRKLGVATREDAVRVALDKQMLRAPG